MILTTTNASCFYSSTLQLYNSFAQFCRNFLLDGVWAARLIFSRILKQAAVKIRSCRHRPSSQPSRCPAASHNLPPRQRGLVWFEVFLRRDIHSKKTFLPIDYDDENYEYDDDNDDNFDAHDDDNNQKPSTTMTLWSKYSPFKYYYLVKKKGPNQPGRGRPPPPLNGQCPFKNVFF